MKIEGIISKEQLLPLLPRFLEIAKSSDFDFHGVRIQDVDTMEVGDRVEHLSHVYDDGEDTGEEIPGISTIDLRRVEGADICYSGSIVYLLGANEAERGEDPGELVLCEDYSGKPVVLAKEKIW